MVYLIHINIDMGDRIMRKEIDRFNAKADSGKMYTITIYQEYIPAGTLDSPHDMIEGPKSVFTSSGDRVNRIDSETYQIVQTGEIVYRCSV